MIRFTKRFKNGNKHMRITFIMPLDSLNGGTPGTSLYLPSPNSREPASMAGPVPWPRWKFRDSVWSLAVPTRQKQESLFPAVPNSSAGRFRIPSGTSTVVATHGFSDRGSTVLACRSLSDGLPYNGYASRGRGRSGTAWRRILHPGGRSVP